MSNPLFYVVWGSELFGKVYTSDSTDFSPDDKEQICKRLDITVEEVWFEASTQSKSDSDIGKPPSYTNEKGRKFWIFERGEDPELNT